MLQTVSVIGLEFFSMLDMLESGGTVDWKWRAPGKPDSNEENNSNPIPETVYSVVFLVCYLGGDQTIKIKILLWNPNLKYYFIQNMCNQSRS